MPVDSIITTIITSVMVRIITGSKVGMPKAKGVTNPNQPAAKVVELRFFSGLESEEVAEALGVQSDDPEAPYWRLLGRLNSRSRTPCEVLPRSGRDSSLSYTGNRISALLRPLEIEAQHKLLDSELLGGDKGAVGALLHVLAQGLVGEQCVHVERLADDTAVQARALGGVAQWRVVRLFGSVGAAVEAGAVVAEGTA